MTTFKRHTRPSPECLVWLCGNNTWEEVREYIYMHASLCVFPVSPRWPAPASHSRSSGTDPCLCALRGQILTTTQGEFHAGVTVAWSGSETICIIETDLRGSTDASRIASVRPRRQRRVTTHSVTLVNLVTYSGALCLHQGTRLFQK